MPLTSFGNGIRTGQRFVIHVVKFENGDITMTVFPDEYQIDDAVSVLYR
jgi:hypothetical protein